MARLHDDAAAELWGGVRRWHVPLMLLVIAMMVRRRASCIQVLLLNAILKQQRVQRHVFIARADAVATILIAIITIIIGGIPVIRRYHNWPNSTTCMPLA